MARWREADSARVTSNWHKHTHTTASTTMGIVESITHVSVCVVWPVVLFHQALWRIDISSAIRHTPYALRTHIRASSPLSTFAISVPKTDASMLSQLNKNLPSLIPQKPKVRRVHWAYPFMWIALSASPTFVDLFNFIFRPSLRCNLIRRSQRVDV